ncbi:putative disease resistance RPP13-like protein 1 [Papaver somniferum]|uniref:putative disease resistance RPP13-like protein 1 n=1 Tax=Papaver somniferum TaxID=3469 RepID=UPI000E7007B9|nr:putative disease resistance RPP13-like protein 1 [Papaver somniferum]
MNILSILMWSSFFQDVQKDAESGYIATCKMHDLVHDLAMSLLDNNELGTVKVGDRNAEVSQVRRLQMLFNGGRSLEAPKGLSNALKLRTIIAVEPYTFPHINSFFRSKRLRILCPCPGLLSGWRGCSLSCGLKSCKLCFASSKLKYLRYLDLSYVDLSRGLSLNYSCSLHTLVLRECKNVPSWLLSKIGSLKSLRHVDVSYSDIKFLPQDIGSLEHLSCIDLSGTSISELPDSITCISSLRTLKLYACRNLNAFPRELGALTQLRFLDLNGTKIRELPKSCINSPCNLEIVKLGYGCQLPKEIKNWPKLRIFTHNSYSDAMPRCIERLTCLERLEDYIVNKEIEICGSEDTNCSSGSGIEELAGLNTLEVLTIRNLENVRGQTDAERACLKGKQCIRLLQLHWSSCRSNDEDSMVLEGLQPHSNLKELKIQRFQGSKLPYWMGLSYCLPNLVELCLFQCDRCDKLTGLGLLPCLRVLHIKGMNSVKILGKEFYYHEEGESSSSSVSTTEYGKIFLFPSLDELSFDGMESLVEWVRSPPPPYYSFPLLKSLSIKKCQRLKTTPNSFPSLKSLELEDINDRGVRSFLASTEGLTSLTSISYPGHQSNFRC